MSNTNHRCPDCGRTLSLEMVVTVHDTDPDNSKLLFRCNRCEKYVFQIKPDFHGKTFLDRQAYMIKLARKHLIDDSVLRRHQRIIAKARRAAVNVATSA